MMNRRLPIISFTKRICVICEGDEEVDYLARLIELKVWNEKYKIKLLNAEGNGNIAARYQDAYQSGYYDAVFAFVDTDRKPHDQYKTIKNKIDNIFGIEGASKYVVIFGNPCTMQIILLHFSDIRLISHQKNKNRKIIEDLTGIDSYNAKKEKRDALFSLINIENYSKMLKRIDALSNDDKEHNSSNFGYFVDCLSNEDDSWCDELDKVLNS